MKITLNTVLWGKSLHTVFPVWWMSWIQYHPLYLPSPSWFILIRLPKVRILWMKWLHAAVLCTVLRRTLVFHECVCGVVSGAVRVWRVSSVTRCLRWRRAPRLCRVVPVRSANPRCEPFTTCSSPRWRGYDCTHTSPALKKQLHLLVSQ